MNEAGIAIEEGELAGGEAARGEPLHGLRLDLGQADDVAEGLTPVGVAIGGGGFLFLVV